MLETQKTISDWAAETFGPVGTNLRVAVRMQAEMSELLTKLAVNDTHPGAAEEVADIFIVAARLMERLGVDLAEAVKLKMEINRAPIIGIDQAEIPKFHALIDVGHAG